MGINCLVPTRIVKQTCVCVCVIQPANGSRRGAHRVHRRGLPERDAFHWRGVEACCRPLHRRGETEQETHTIARDNPVACNSDPSIYKREEICNTEKLSWPLSVTLILLLGWNCMFSFSYEKRPTKLKPFRLFPLQFDLLDYVATGAHPWIHFMHISLTVLF